MSRPLDFVFDEIDSTQDFLKNKIKEEGALTKPVWARARSQSRGRGRSGRTWLNSDGALLISCAFRSEETPQNRQLFLPFVSFLAFGSLYRALQRLYPDASSRLQFKWPNDLVTPAVSGVRKVAGILCEGCASDHLVVGWGVNISGVHKEVSDLASSLEELSQLRPSIDDLSRALRDEFESDVLTWLKNPLQAQARIIAELSSVLTGFLGRHGNLQDGRRVEAAYIDERGILWVRDLNDGRVEPLHSGEFLLS